MDWTKIPRSLVFILAVIAIASAVVIQAQTNTTTAAFTATSANVAGAGDPIRINIIQWSTDADRDKLVTAWNPPPAPAGGARGARGAGARGGGADAGDEGNGGRGRGGAPAAPPTPAASLMAAVQEAETVGYLWTSESIGYSLRYAYRIPQPDGGERLILITNRRLGASNPRLWQATSGGATPTDYEFTLIELRVNSAGAGEGKTSLVTPIAVDAQTRSLALENYAAAPVMLENVKR